MILPITTWRNLSLYKLIRQTHSHRTTILGALLSLVLASSPLTVWAHQSPGTCNGNRFNTSIIRDHVEVYQGDTLTYTVTASNVNALSDIACDVTAASITVTLPALDGTATGTVVTLVTNVDYPSGTPVGVVGTVSYVVNVNPGVSDITAQVSAIGTLHDAPSDHSALIQKTIGTTVLTASAISPPSVTSTSPQVFPGLPNTGLW